MLGPLPQARIAPAVRRNGSGPGGFSKVKNLDEREFHTIKECIEKIMMADKAFLDKDLKAADLTAKLNTVIGDLVGFGSQAAYYRVFEKHCGMTPLQYRLKHGRK